MQVSKRTIRQLKLQMKAYFPGEYASVVVDKLQEKRITVTLQQVYNFFNNISVSKRNEILNAALDILADAKERNRQLDELLSETIQ